MIDIFVLHRQKIEALIQLIEDYQNQINELQEKIALLKAENNNLKTINNELQWRVNPYSSDGDAICNSDE